MIGCRLWQIAGWTMLHYLWVGAALGAVGLLVRRQLRSAPASVRYLVALGSLMLLASRPSRLPSWYGQPGPLPQRCRCRWNSAGLPDAMRVEESRPSAAARAHHASRGRDPPVRTLEPWNSQRLWRRSIRP